MTKAALLCVFIGKQCVWSINNIDIKISENEKISSKWTLLQNMVKPIPEMITSGGTSDENFVKISIGEALWSTTS